ncbi:unnamed protein product [Clonostachys rosea]|uniref:Uncharacterized protein n=1 Tax=Bionectria ochroleuca TaxID=29856 RepID=A0ABY6U7K6_BIOOC|nr:unnamed protein product [Clonostachys rosea]
MPANPQSRSAFVTRLPREVRDAIYLELWRSIGLRQHIVSHRDQENGGPEPPGWHFCRWRCITDFEVEDRLQQEIELLRIEQAQDTEPSGLVYSIPYQKRLASPWHNHWACGEEIEKVYGEEIVMSPSTSGFKCWKHMQPKLEGSPTPVPQPKPHGKLRRFFGKFKHRKSRFGSRGDESTGAGHELGPYFPMLLSCKMLSSECLKSLYESTTFVFTDVLALQRFVGVCQPNSTGDVGTDNGNKPAGFLRYARNLELTVDPVFHLDISCSTEYEATSTENYHNPYNFHWLKLHQFQNLTSIKIWVSARTFQMHNKPFSRDWKTLDELDVDGLKNFFSPLEGIEPEDGFVKGITRQPSHRVWKRGTGDSFHPNMNFDYGTDRPYASIVNVDRRYNSPLSGLALPIMITDDFFPSQEIDNFLDLMGIRALFTSFNSTLASVHSRIGAVVVLIEPTLELVAQFVAPGRRE